jgi:hypothetical protein
MRELWRVLECASDRFLLAPSAVQQDNGRPLTHRQTVRHERSAVDVEP